MNTPVDRFKKRKAILEGKTIQNMPIDAAQPSILTDGTVHSIVADRLNDNAALISAEANTLLSEIHGRIDGEKFSILIEACQKECLLAVIRPFGIGQVLFKNKIGGNVDTIHNVRLRIYATSREQELYKDRGDYSSVIYHRDARYIEENRKTTAVQNAGLLIDSYGNKPIGKKNLDHVKSAKENHDDAGRVLAGLKGEDLASLPSNLKATTETINKSKKQKSVEKFIEWVDKTKIPTLRSDIKRLEGKASPSVEDLQKIEKLKGELTKFEEIDRKKMRSADKDAREAIECQINGTYYKSNKFLKNTAFTSLNESGKMALQQAIGVLMEEFVRAAFAEVKDAWKNGFKGSVDDAFLDALNERLMRVARRVQTQWKDAASAALNGGISGFLSNLVTVIINIFATTKAHLVRMLREGFFSLYRALKMLAFPPEGLSLAQAADAASKLIATGLITAAGIGLEVALEAHLAALGPLAPWVSSIGAGVVTGLGTAFVVYTLDHLDFFGVNTQSRHEHVVAQLNDMISISYDRAMEAASVFSGPALLHLT